MNPFDNISEKDIPKPESPAQTPDQRPLALAAAFAELERLGTFADIADPGAWQREIRRDRPLPGREHF